MKRLGSSINDCLDSTDVRFPSAIGSSMGMADLVSEQQSLLTDVTLCHDCTSFSIILCIIGIAG